MTPEQLTQLKHFATLFKSTEQLYKIQSEPLTMMPYMYGEEIASFVQFCYENELVVTDYDEIASELQKNFKDSSWLQSLSEHQLLQCLSLFIRKDRFVDGLLAARIEDGTINNIINALVLQHNH